MRTYYRSPIGWLEIRADSGSITDIRSVAEPSASKAADCPILRQAIQWLRRYFAGENPAPGQLPLSPRGTPFQMTVWNLLLQIPYGQQVSYGTLAKQISPTMSPQAVGNAVGRNPILILIPCHRVLGSGSQLTGFSAGIEKKIGLLQLENIPFSE